jgi:hypothetical protein
MHAHRPKSSLSSSKGAQISTYVYSKIQTTPTQTYMQIYIYTQKYSQSTYTQTYTQTRRTMSTRYMAWVLQHRSLSSMLSAGGTRFPLSAGGTRFPLSAGGTRFPLSLRHIHTHLCLALEKYKAHTCIRRHMNVHAFMSYRPRSHQRVGKIL